VVFSFKAFVLSLSVVFLSCFFISSSQAAAVDAPAFSLKGDNGQISLNKYRGKVIYLDFWASWCVPCRKSFPWMNAMQNKYKAKGLVVIGVNLDDNREAAKAFLSQVPADFTIAYDPDGETPGKYQVEVMPTSYLIDRDGKLVYKHRGFKKSQSAEMEHKISSLLAN